MKLETSRFDRVWLCVTMGDLGKQNETKQYADKAWHNALAEYNVKQGLLNKCMSLIVIVVSKIQGTLWDSGWAQWKCNLQWNLSRHNTYFLCDQTL